MAKVLRTLEDGSTLSVEPAPMTALMDLAEPLPIGSFVPLVVRISDLRDGFAVLGEVVGVRQAIRSGLWEHSMVLPVTVELD